VDLTEYAGMGVVFERNPEDFNSKSLNNE